MPLAKDVDLDYRPDDVAKAVDGTANYITAAICKTTSNQPSNVCTPGITALQAKMKPAG